MLSVVCCVSQEQFITAKYVERRYICLPETYPGATAQTGLWEAVEGGNLRYCSFNQQEMLLFSVSCLVWHLGLAL